MKIVIASGNKGKIEEFRKLLSPLDVEIVTQDEIEFDLEIIEDGETFRDNARIKAKELMEYSGLPSLADDSGLCVDALGGKPGVHTARYGGEGLTDDERMDLLLSEMEGVENRKAKFVCSLVLAFPDGRENIEVEDICEGEIGLSKHGGMGFGYDPIFYVSGKSFSDLTQEEKNSMSHRGKAMKKLYSEIEKLK